MDDMEILIKGALLHDIGKVCYRAGKRINHSEAGYKFLQENRLLTDDEENERIFRCIRYHHKDYLKNVVKELSDCDLAYIVYEAGNSRPVRKLKELCVLFNVSSDYILGTEGDETETEVQYSADEQRLIEVYRKLDERGKKNILRNAEGELDMLGGK